MSRQDEYIIGNYVTDAEAANIFYEFIAFLEEKLGEDEVLSLIQEYNKRIDEHAD